ncbi:MAG TPA: hypothetical protein VI588_04190, partial [Candidatus Gracilibacteria bacterium]|nr:hypothetical protein [Candidatus Gracilibacteria bacterium]
MYDTDNFIAVFSRDPALSTGNIAFARYAFNAGGPPTAGSAPNTLSDFTATTGSQSNPRITSDYNGLTFVVWTDFPTISTENHIYGKFLSAQTPQAPAFRINSTQSGSQSLPSTGMNASGEAVVAWEGNVNQPGLSDSNGIATQLLQNPLNLQEVDPLSPIAQQEIQAGGQFLDVPTNITFPAVAISTSGSTIQAVSIRDAVNGGSPLKYIEIQDATGVDFNLTVQASDFFAQADNRPYITNEAHFKVRNWDQDTTDVDNAVACGGDALVCFQTIESSVIATAFTLGTETESFTYVNTQKVLAEKTGTVASEIGIWRIFPEFQITVPSLIPPGVHEAVITFTLTGCKKS